MKTLLIDGDMVAWLMAYRPVHVGQRAVTWVRTVQHNLIADRSIVCFSDPSRDYWRRQFWPAYKTRASDPPPDLAEAKAAMAGEFVSRTLPGMEADDVMGILATSPTVQGRKIIVANDKDMLSIPGIVYRPRDKQFFESHERDADRWHLTQTLTGDSSDGYPGCPGIGPEKAERVLAPASSLNWAREAWIRVVLAYKARGLTEADALVQARVARICRACDFNLETMSVIPWQAPSTSPTSDP